MHKIKGPFVKADDENVNSCVLKFKLHRSVF